VVVGVTGAAFPPPVVPAAYPKALPETPLDSMGDEEVREEKRRAVAPTKMDDEKCIFESARRRKSEERG